MKGAARAANQGFQRKAVRPRRCEEDGTGVEDTLDPDSDKAAINWAAAASSNEELPGASRIHRRLAKEVQKRNARVFA